MAMTPEQKAAYIQAQAVCALIEAMGMQALNRDRDTKGLSLAYDDEAFFGLIEKYGIHHNATVELFHGG